jgi:hypothetical protein
MTYELLSFLLFFTYKHFEDKSSFETIKILFSIFSWITYVTYSCGICDISGKARQKDTTG